MIAKGNREFDKWWKLWISTRSQSRNGYEPQPETMARANIKCSAGPELHNIVQPKRVVDPPAINWPDSNAA